MAIRRSRGVMVQMSGIAVIMQTSCLQGLTTSVSFATLTPRGFRKGGCCCCGYGTGWLKGQQFQKKQRAVDHSYRVWEGSDVDIEARINEGRRKLQLESVSPLESLCHHMPSRILVALADFSIMVKQLLHLYRCVHALHSL